MASKDRRRTASRRSHAPRAAPRRASKRCRECRIGWRFSCTPPGGKFIAKLLQLGRDDESAIGLLWIIREIFLVVILGDEERGGRPQLGDDRAAEGAFVVEFGDELFGSRALRVVVKEDDAAVLRPGIVALAVHRRGVVHGEKHFKNIAERSQCRVECDLHYFYVTGSAGTDGAIVGVRDVPAHVS